MAATETTAIVAADTEFASCYGCGKCSSGCPVADQMDFRPHQAMRLLQLGDVETLVAAAAPWVCVGCQTCLARCPNKVDIPSAFTCLRHEAERRGTLDNAGNLPMFEDILLGMIRKNGRINDGLMAAKYKFKAGGLLRDWRLGMKMFLTGKMKLLSPKVADRAGVAKLFAESPEEKR